MTLKEIRLKYFESEIARLNKLKAKEITESGKKVFKAIIYDYQKSIDRIKAEKE